VYRKFLELNLPNRPAIRGQLEGPISFGLRAVHQDDRPIIFDDTVWSFMLEFMAKRVNVQLSQLKKLNANTFIIDFHGTKSSPNILLIGYGKMNYLTSSIRGNYLP